ncbi:MAG: methyl-accepting chemotaxis protein [Thermincolia bacterium]
MNLPWYKSLRSKLAFAIVVAVVVPMMVALFLARQEATKMLEAKYDVQLETTLKGVNWELRQNHEMVALLAKDFAINLENDEHMAKEEWPEVTSELQQLYRELGRDVGLSLIRLTSDGNKIIEIKEGNVYGNLLEETKSFTTPSGKTYQITLSCNDFDRVVKDASQITGAEATIFLGNKIIATNEVENRFVKGYEEKDSEVLEDVLKKGKNTFKVYHHNGEETRVLYTPFKDSKGSIVGMIAVHKSNEFFRAEILAMGKAIMFGALLLSLVGGLLGFILAARFTAPLRRLAKHSEDIAQGDLAAVTLVESGDEMGHLNRAFSQMVKRLAQLISQLKWHGEHVAQATGQLNENADQVARVADQVAATMQDFTAGAQEQVTKVNEIHEFIIDMNKGVHQVTEGAKAVRKASIDAYKFAEEGNETLINAVEQMNALKESIASSSGTVKELGDKSQSIGKIIDVITSIAKQTNLLALNAAIEAARAGDQGRGFAVVADEVRKLAEQSAEAATQVAAIIGEFRFETSKAVEAMEAGNKSVELGMKVIAKTEESLELIVKSVREVYQEIQDLNPIIQQMAEKSEEVNSSMDVIATIAQGTQDNSQHIMASLQEQVASVDHIVESITELAKMSEELKQLTHKFRVL